MLALVAIANVIVALLNFYLAWKLRQWRRAIACLADTLTCAEARTRQTLPRAPELILQGQQECRALAQRYRQLQRQWQQLSQLLGVLRFLSLFLPQRWRVQNPWGTSLALGILRPRQSRDRGERP